MPSLESTQKALQRLRAAGSSRALRLAVVLSILYLVSWQVVERSAVRKRQADFFENRARSWVELGAMRFEGEAFDRFTGTLYHPLALVTLGAPAGIAAVAAAMGAALLLAGLLAGLRASALERRERRDQARMRLEELRIRADASAPRAIVAAGASGGLVATLLHTCGRCKSQYQADATSQCPNCGAPAGGVSL
jgi:hypothetical protein